MKSATIIQGVPIAFALLLLLQSCTVYKGSITLEEAVSSQKKVKVYATSSEKALEFERIEKIDGAYKGIPKRYSQSQEVILDEENIRLIKEEDNTTSTIITFSPLVVIGILGMVLFSGDGDGGY